jgi:molybdate transport system ATP-binding protein
MASLRIRISVPRRAFAVRVDLAVGAEVVALVGPSGAGKTTVLRAVAGLEPAAEGLVAVDDRAWLDSSRGVDLPAEERRVGYLFQDHALFPHLTVAQNVAFAGGRRGPELMERLGVAPLAAARPGELSGGERQRVALARALARAPEVLLLDEPTAALDAQTRDSVRGELRELTRELGLPTLLVTHDFAEAAALADRVGVMVGGEVLQSGTPAELVARPRDPFVATFVGGNMLTGRARPGADGLTEVVLDAGGVVRSTDPGDGAVGVVVQPWEVSVARAAATDSALNHIAATIGGVVPLGNRVRVTVGPVVAEITAASAERLGLAPGQPAVATFKAAGTRLVPLGRP